MYILNYACTTAAGGNVSLLMNSLREGRDTSQPAWAGGRVCFIEGEIEKSESHEDILSRHLQNLWSDLAIDFGKDRVALIFASTKGIIEDYIWQSDDQEIRAHLDPYSAVLKSFRSAHPEINWSLSCNVSNACCSSHVAFEYVQDLLSQGRVDSALIIAADLVGPFIYKGFSALKVVSPTRNRPFSADRDGLQLGEAVTMIAFSKEPRQKTKLRILNVASDTEGSSITRPSVNGAGLVRALQKMQDLTPLTPDLVVAHGTGTKFNDFAEDLALRQFLVNLGVPETPVTNTKWSIGHTLGASGSVDLIAACEILKSQSVFAIANTGEKDPDFQMNYVTSKVAMTGSPIAQILITSLGFGGVHAALSVERMAEIR